MTSYERQREALDIVNDMLEQQATLARRAQRQSITQLLGAWDQFVQSVDEGYDWSIYEYTNDLSVRDRIAQVLAVIPPGSLEWIGEAVAATDARFRIATRDDESMRSGAEQDWWRRRVPLRPGGELAADLASEGR